ncbi:Voltage-gated Ion Channel (VIC) Superfamily [Phytophthora palmivora]|uniref:Voltage-gated Ion Channel (VIC) Superfamily n=1 Tax=Phytophthora palmivora TaxID=4796 RepID=A0A2P4YB08_9STRA|nr:Voltage-gated Ion Channel (VIC) Superfamily [Phytophthora palmivora]
MDLIPSALAEITSMVEQIRQTTELLSLRLGTNDDLDDDEDDDFDYEDDYNDDMSFNLRDSTPFPPLTEESEEEMARRESNSIFVPNAPGSAGNSRNSSRLFGDKRGSDPSTMLSK